MKLLAIDTSSIACSVALQAGDTVLERHEEQPREHTRLLMPMINAVLADASLRVSDLDAIVLGNGPGSFIGMRIAAAVAQGLAHGAGIGIVPVSSLAAVAAEVFATGPAGAVAVAQDAHMNEVYLGIFERRDDGLPSPLTDECLHSQTPIEALEECAAASRVAAGFGWERYPALLAANRPWIDQVSPVRHPRARHLLPMAAAAARQGGVIAPRDVAPAYLRHKVAETPSRPTT
ncbi:MAG TPA: tRNA (adenosine(37)-N6)-threonylcarbamoyltransferase complex dimerization subunit type 1 TsaB [Woeseiaceae bacterium]